MFFENKHPAVQQRCIPERFICYCIFSHENQHNGEVAFRGFWSTYSLNTWGQHTWMEGQEQNHGVLFLRRCWLSEIDNLSENCQPLHL